MRQTTPPPNTPDAAPEEIKEPFEVRLWKKIWYYLGYYSRLALYKKTKGNKINETTLCWLFTFICYNI